MIAYLIAGVCVLGVVAIWFVTAHKELSTRRQNLNSLCDQLLMHENACAQARGVAGELAIKMLKTNRMVYQQAVQNYNRLLKKPTYRLPALLMRFHFVDESDSASSLK